MERGRWLLERISMTGAAAQSCIPGVYAWGVTVAPAALARGSPVAKVAAAAGLVSLAIGIAGDRRWGYRARIGSLWGFVVASGVAWIAAPAAVGAMKLDTLRGLAGMLGWGLFALASAAPAEAAALATDETDGQGRAELAVRPSSRARIAGPIQDWVYVAGGVLLAVLLQSFGWHVAVVERGLLLRFVSVAAGLSVVGAACRIALARHEPRTPAARSTRVRRALAPLVALGLLLAAGLVLFVRR